MIIQKVTDGFWWNGLTNNKLHILWWSSLLLIADWKLILFWKKLCVWCSNQEGIRRSGDGMFPLTRPFLSLDLCILNQQWGTLTSPYQLSLHNAGWEMRKPLLAQQSGFSSYQPARPVWQSWRGRQWYWCSKYKYSVFDGVKGVPTLFVFLRFNTNFIRMLKSNSCLGYIQNKPPHAWDLAWGTPSRFQTFYTFYCLSYFPVRTLCFSWFAVSPFPFLFASKDFGPEFYF